ncbi:hypothetical protein R52603_00919 [Paraburkholderia saeva]|jgi:hypothetical protein|uniref:Uncharacterized protein n=1 Tax=Paraburkholderia saeva TaxID=2777537 RepID=A0A9N8X507_9BURK|nr:hypothetical protein R52603_00919 [Paraburkholderia saeva]CAG4917667.1 hypothetical protein LMG31841_04705 [Paraburkholderia saeva]
MKPGIGRVVLVADLAGTVVFALEGVPDVTRDKASVQCTGLAPA